MYADRFDGKTVLVTGNTGFKGSWLSIYLLRLGAKVIGYSLEPPTDPNLYTRAGLESKLVQVTGDVRDTPHFTQVISRHRPDFIFHLAAQPLVLESYHHPTETFDVNVMGSISVMEAVRQLDLQTIVIMVTTDKVYENREWVYGYREEDHLGGYDPYSASKAAMEIAVSSYNRSFFSGETSDIRVASVRSGNVIGGGDWAIHRIVPDCIKSLLASHPIPVRNPQATRPWQHVLEPLSGYLWLAAELSEKPEYAGAWNFGPTLASNCTVKTLVELMIRFWGEGVWEDQSSSHAPHEANLLQLSIDKVQKTLGWQPVWDFEQTIRQTVSWYRAESATDDGETILELCNADIDVYESAAQTMQLPWCD